MVDAVSSSLVDGLYPVGQRPPLGAYLAETWRRRSFAFTLAGQRLVGSLVRNRLGMLWLVLKPLSMALIYGTIFGLILSGAARPPGFAQYVIVGTFVFEFFTGSLGSGAKSITSNAKLVQSLGFPRILLPVSTVIEQAMRMVPIVCLLYILLIAFGEPITWKWLLVIPILLLMGIFNLGVALIVARMTVVVRDVQQLIPILNRLLFYGSGILFNVDGALAHLPVALTAVHLLPTYEFIAMARDAVLSTYTVPLIAWIAAPIWAVGTLLFGVIYFWRAEARYGLSD
ncbi:ABC transporter permease [Microbacterium sp. ARD32]|uniref:ABC transporter permease n=1 Tax=Microbacterium sp. ARD32 TaxID=2962577 RepID=UPI0028817DF5|nr:ABC transporter permease [Microbacterium sp. ARD32]MDT0156396.1 ABC transporter permease [Microbacterium sp. ARD32]